MVGGKCEDGILAYCPYHARGTASDEGLRKAEHGQGAVSVRFQRRLPHGFLGASTPAGLLQTHPLCVIRRGSVSQRFQHNAVSARGAVRARRPIKAIRHLYSIHNIHA